MSDVLVLDNPVWQALTTRHAALNRGRGLAARYPGDVSRFVGLAEPSAAAFADLAGAVAPGEVVALVTPDAPDVPAPWRVQRARALEQMVCVERPVGASALPLPLGEADVPEMLALTAATQPGPFAAGTIQMGRYFGVREGGVLAAMAGERLKPGAFTEISAVCTDPAFRGRGYAKMLTLGLAAMAFAKEYTPFLHVKTENGAKGLYEAWGFRVRRSLHLTVLVRP